MMQERTSVRAKESALQFSWEKRSFLRSTYSAVSGRMTSISRRNALSGMSSAMLAPSAAPRSEAAAQNAPRRQSM